MNIKSTLLSTAIVASLSLSAVNVSAAELEGFSANIGVTSDYLWRGISQTDGKPAVSGGLDYETDFGISAGTWVSNVDFGDESTYELDAYVDFGGEISSLSYSLGYIYYAYPDGADLDFGEINGSLSISYFTVGAAILTHADGADFADNNYIYGDVAFPVADDLELGVHLGTYLFDQGDDYIDYNLYADYKGLNFMLSATDLDDDDLKAVVSYNWGF